MGTEKKHLFY